MVQKLFQLENFVNRIFFCHLAFLIKINNKKVQIKKVQKYTF